MYLANNPILNSISSYIGLRSFIKYRPNVKVHIETSKFLVKTADSFQEIYSALLLRGKVFKNSYFKIDFDEYDFIFDHLIVKDKEKNKVIGTYRLNSSKFTNNFYSKGEFHLDDFLAMPGNKLELGRACIHQKYRNGKTIDLLWKGIGQYACKTDTDYLFGCTSIKSTEIYTICAISNFFDIKQIADFSYNVRPKNNFSYDVFYEEFQEKEKEEQGRPVEVPPLLKSYLFSGAKICGHPYFDYDFKCSDFMTILEMKNVNKLFQKRYFRRDQ